MPASDSVAVGRYACASKYDADGTPTDVKLHEITGWTMDEANTDATYISCETGGIKKRVDGDYDVTGTLSGVVNIDNPIRDAVKVGDEFVLHLFTRRPAVGVTGQFHKVPVRVISISTGANLEESGPQRWTLNWGLSVTDDVPLPLFDQEAAALS